ncbi:MAG: efflux RND transporter periplasmic adaptor subunit [Fusobacteriaceae bacterium]
MRNKIIFILILTALLGCKKEETPISNDLAIRPVKYMVVNTENSIITREFSGTVAPKTISELSFRVAGTIVEKYANLGSKVKKGDVLAKLDPSEYQIKSDGIRAQYQEAEARIMNAKSVYLRSKTLFLGNSISKNQYEQDKANYQASLAQLDAAGQNRDFAKNQLEYTILKAPSDGIVAQVDAQLNEAVNAGTPVFTLSESGDLQAVFSVSDVVINQLYENQIVSIRSISGGEVFKGKVSNIGAISNAYGNTFPVKADIINPTVSLKPGMTLSVKVDFKNEDAGTIYTPVNSVQIGNDGKNFVMVLTNIKDEIAVVEKREITVGEISSTGVEIISGLKSGDYIVTSGNTVITNGQNVKLGVKEEK